MRFLFSFTIVLIASTLQLLSLPQFALMTGNKCISCHITSQGGSLRSELGAYSYAEVGMIDPDKLGLGSLFQSIEENTFYDGKLTLGLDARFQTVRGHTSPDDKRKYFPMQGSIYAQYAPFDEVKLEANYNAGHSSKNRFPGQQPWLGSVLIQPSYDLPILRIGRFAPSIGIKYDDHSKLIRQYITNSGVNLSTNFMPPSIAEYGAELTYDSWHSMTVSAGVFGSSASSEINIRDINGNAVSVISAANKPTIAARLQLLEQFFDMKLNTFVGSSLLANDDYTNIRGFAGLGLTDEAALMIEYSQTEKKNYQKTSIISIDGMYSVINGLYATARFETGSTIVQSSKEYDAYSIVLGVQAFVLPHVEIRPEYRIMDTNDFRSSRWAVQLHLFY